MKENNICNHDYKIIDTKKKYNQLDYSTHIWLKEDKYICCKCNKNIILITKQSAFISDLDLLKIEV